MRVETGRTGPGSVERLQHFPVVPNPQADERQPRPISFARRDAVERLAGRRQANRPDTQRMKYIPIGAVVLPQHAGPPEAPLEDAPLLAPLDPLLLSPLLPLDPLLLTVHVLPLDASPDVPAA